MKLCGFEVGLDRPLFLIAGPCVVESEQLQMDVAGKLKEIAGSLGVPFIFKSSYDKANRSSGTSFRGPGLDKGLEILAKVKRELQVPIVTDVHREDEIGAAASVVDVLQTPAVPVPADRLHPRRRAEREARQHQEGPVPRPARHDQRARQGARRGARRRPLGRPLHGLRARRELRLQQPRLRHASLAIMRETNAPVVFDATHSVQLPAARARRRAASASSFRCWRARRSRSASPASSWKRIRIPAQALSDGPNAVPLKHMRALLEQLAELDRAIKSRPLLEQSFDA
jgi:2-dehydro-3-deoxyphosphooctonate aldolase (KDO 8-P synthase)